MNHYNGTWSREAIEVSERAIERHGGLQAWESLNSIKLRPLFLKGLIPLLRGYPKSFPLPESIEIFPKERRVILHQYPQKEFFGEFSKGDVRIFKQSNPVEPLTEILKATHSAVQTFYFDKTGLLRRNDYQAAIIGIWALGAHCSQGYTDISGIQVALQRRVLPRLGTMTFPINALSADLEPI